MSGGSSSSTQIGDLPRINCPNQGDKMHEQEQLCVLQVPKPFPSLLITSPLVNFHFLVSVVGLSKVGLLYVAEQQSVHIKGLRKPIWSTRAAITLSC